MNRWLNLLLALWLPLAACPEVLDDDDSLADDDDVVGDDDSALDDDDSALDDDDSALDDDDSSGDGDLGDDDDIAPDDDDIAPDDDDIAPDDDDIAPDDDDIAPDDDDSAADPGDAFLNRTYCLDWDTVTITEPSALGPVLPIIGVNLSDFPLLLNPTALDPATGDIWMTMGVASTGTCEQDMTFATLDVTDPDAGAYSTPHFDVGPTDVLLPTVQGDLTLFGTTLSGDFTGDAGTIVDSTVSGLLDASSFVAACSFSTIPCVPCPNAAPGDPDSCFTFTATGGIWTDNGLGPLTWVP